MTHNVRGLCGDQCIRGNPSGQQIVWARSCWCQHTCASSRSSSISLPSRARKTVRGCDWPSFPTIVSCRDNSHPSVISDIPLLKSARKRCRVGQSLLLMLWQGQSNPAMQNMLKSLYVEEVKLRGAHEETHGTLGTLPLLAGTTASAMLSAAGLGPVAGALERVGFTSRPACSLYHQAHASPYAQGVHLYGLKAKC